MGKFGKKHFFLLLLLIVGGSFYLWSTQASPSQISEEKVARDSGFLESIRKAEAEAEAKRKAEEEAKRKAEEERKFIATYGPCRRVPILMYHHVDNQGGGLYVRPDVFAQQMDYLVAQGYQTVGLAQVAAGLASGQGLPEKPVVITFDDGYRDVFNHAFPVLQSRGLKATVFLITQLMDGGEFMTWEQAREMKSSGVFTIGDHTLDHRSMGSMNEEELRNEIFNSKRIIDENLGGSVNVFAYPYGSANSQAVSLLQEAGFVAAAVSSPGWACAKLPFGLPRIRVGNASLASYGL